jgi:glycosyltransferase involved in cell wall biosynthesis
MQQVFQDEYEVQADLQLPAIAPPLHDRHRQEENQGEKTSPQFEIVYAGTSTSAVAVPLQMLVDVVRSGKLEKQGIDARFTLYTLPPDEEWKRAHGWDHPAINVQGWLSQAELPRALQHADVLFLPFSFEETEKPWVSQSFPSKTADYVAAGRPILVFGPPYSSIVRYASQTGCAEIVQTPDPDALAGAIARIANSPACREQLRARSLQIFRKNHDILRQRAQLHATLERVAHAGRTGTQNVTMSPCKDQEAIPSSLLVKEKE